MTNIFEKMKQLSSYSTHPITFTYDESQKLNKDAMKSTSFVMGVFRFSTA